jgi:hypothetical protein
MVTFNVMKHFYRKFQALILTFTIGIFVVWYWTQFSQFDISSTSLSDISLIWRVPKSFVTYSLSNTKFKEQVKISLIETGEDSLGKYIVLQAENMSQEALYFRGYSINSPCLFRVKSETQVVENRCFCGVGLERQTLLTGESATFRVRPLFEAEKIRVGFEFKVKIDEPAQTFWSDEITLSK